MEIAANLASFSRVELPANGLKAASVAVCIVLQQVRVSHFEQPVWAWK